MSKRQHHKGKKRPRSWHRSRRSQYAFYRALRRVERAFRKAETEYP